MKRCLFLVIFALFSVSGVFAGEPRYSEKYRPYEIAREYIWPEGKMPNYQAHQTAKMSDQSVASRDAYIEWFSMPTNSTVTRTDACVILISGGSYVHCADVGYVRYAWAQALHKVGVQCVNLVYRTPRTRGTMYLNQWMDGQRAVRVIRSQAAKRGFNPEKIGVMSMSAGSHLALLLATSSQTPAYDPVDELDKTVSCHVNWATPFAPAYLLSDGLDGVNRRMGDACDVTLSPALKFDEKTCPMCFLHGGDDPYTPLGSTMAYRKLRQMKIPAEVHLFPDKGHGMFGLDRAIEFMRQMGFLGKCEPEVELMSRFPNDDARGIYEKQFLWSEENMKYMKRQHPHCEMPYLEWHIPKKLTTKAIQIIWSGGGYQGNDPDGFEVAPARRYLNEKGMTVVTVKYRTPRPKAPFAKHTLAWEDAQRAIRLVRFQAAERGLDPDRIGIMGSSAGGHLALKTATTSKTWAYVGHDPCDKAVTPRHVQWAILIYPAYALTDGADWFNKNGGNTDDDRLVTDFAFDLDTPPMLFIHGDADKWAAMNSVKAWEQLRRMGIQGELHTLALRDHCFQKAASPNTGSYTWLDRLWEFLSAKGFTK